MTPQPMRRIVRRDTVPEGGLELDIAASQDELESLARLYDIPSVESLSGRMLVTPWRGRGLKVKGHVEARVVQTCVVTLDPVENAVSEDIEVYFTPQDGGKEMRHTESAPDDDDEKDVEELVGERIDVGALAAEYIALGLDPYPRKPGVAFDPGEPGETETEKGAFAALSVLKGGQKEE